MIDVVTPDAVMDGMIAGLSSVVIPASPAAPPAGAYLRVCERYRGEFDLEQAELSGLAGRCPAVLVGFAGEQLKKRLAAGTFVRVEATLVVFICAEGRRTRADRDADFYKTRADIIRLLGGRAVGLGISPLTYDGMTQVIEKPALTAWGVRWKTRYMIDTSRPPAVVDTLSTLVGTIAGPGGAPNYGGLT